MMLDYSRALTAILLLQNGLSAAAAEPCTIFTQTMFNTTIAPEATSLYSYTGFCNAVTSWNNKYPTNQIFMGATEADQKAEIAAFMGNVRHESDDMKAAREYYMCEVQTDIDGKVYCKPAGYSGGNYNDPYCSAAHTPTSNPDGCACGSIPESTVAPGYVDAEKLFMGRGAIQLSWNYNYIDAGAALEYDLCTGPELVATNEEINWGTAIWFWTSNTGAVGTTCGQFVASGSFGGTVKTINGGLECPAASSHYGSVVSRLNDYCVSATALNVVGLLSLDDCSGLQSTFDTCKANGSCSACSVWDANGRGGPPSPSPPSPSPPSPGPGNYNYCGSDWADANTQCGETCYSGGTCSVGICYADATNCPIVYEATSTSSTTTTVNTGATVSSSTSSTTQQTTQATSSSTTQQTTPATSSSTTTTVNTGATVSSSTSSTPQQTTQATSSSTTQQTTPATSSSITTTSSLVGGYTCIPTEDSVLGYVNPASPDHCELCNDGYEWWPCNTSPDALCQCSDGLTSSTTAASSTTQASTVNTGATVSPNTSSTTTTPQTTSTTTEETTSTTTTTGTSTTVTTPQTTTTATTTTTTSSTSSGVDAVVTCTAVDASQTGGAWPATDDQCRDCSWYNWWPCNTNPPLCKCTGETSPVTNKPTNSPTKNPVETTTSSSSTTVNTGATVVSSSTTTVSSTSTSSSSASFSCSSENPCTCTALTAEELNGLWPATDSQCSVCDEGYDWWPCNAQLCQCISADEVYGRRKLVF